jgi:hypothetical protein
MGAGLVNLVGNGADPGWAYYQYGVWTQVYCSDKKGRSDDDHVINIVMIMMLLGSVWLS